MTTNGVRSDKQVTVSCSCGFIYIHVYVHIQLFPVPVSFSVVSLLLTHYKTQTQVKGYAPVSQCLLHLGDLRST